MCVGGTSVNYTISHAAISSIVNNITVNSGASNSDYVDAGALTSTSFAIGDRLSITINTVTGAVTSFSFQVNFTRP
jgi:hypothetical protein